jgi:hypothetical protein
MFRPKLNPSLLNWEQRKLVGPHSLPIIGQRGVEISKLQSLLIGETQENQTTQSVALAVWL